MTDSTSLVSDSADHQYPSPRERLWPLVLAIVVPAVVAVAALLVNRLDSFDAAPMPIHELGTPITVLLRNDRMLEGAELLGAEELQGPEDIAYDSKSKLIYTGCHDGWIKRLRLNDSVVEDLVNTNGRPLGLALGHNGEVIAADAYKGLLNVSRDGGVEVLTDEADGLKFKLTNGVDIARNGTIYFTDASYKYEWHEHVLDLLEGRPYGRFMSFDPLTRKTTVLLTNLYFPNGVAVSPHQDSAIFCETTMRRCRKYYIQGNKQGQQEKFVDNLPGFPDNIRYDGDGHYWIGLAMGTSFASDLALKYPFIRKARAMIDKLMARQPVGKNAGVLAVDLEGKPVGLYRDHKLGMVASGMKIENRLYCGSVIYPHIIRLDLDRHPATPTEKQI